MKDNTGHFINLSLLPAPARSVWQISRPGAGRMFRKVPEQQLQKFIFYKSLFNCKNKQYIPPELNKLMTINSDTLREDRKSTRLNSSHVASSYAVFSLK